MGERRRRQRRKVSLGPATDREKNIAASKLQGIFRRRQARMRTKLLLRSVFEKVYDPDTGAYFYHNKHTGDTSWEAPKLLGGEDFESIDESQTSPHDAVTAYRSLAAAWQHHYDEGSGNYYYYNISSEETTWNKPDVLAKLEAAIVERDEMLGSDWMESQDEYYNYFFYNKETGESSWEPPKVDFRKTKEEKEREAKALKKEMKRLKKLELEEKKRLDKLESDTSTSLELDSSQASANIVQQLDESSDDDEDESSDGSQPPDALVVGVDDVDQVSDGYSSGSQTVYVSSDEEYRAMNLEREKKMTKRQLKRQLKRKEKRRRQKDWHLEKLISLALAPDVERRAYEARTRIKSVARKKLKTLNLVDLQLTTVPSQIMTDERVSKRLECLNVGMNRIKEIPTSIKALRDSVKVLKFDTNQIIDIPVQIWFCTNLEELDLRNNSITLLPREKGNMEILREINIWDIGLETLTKLKTFRIDRNQLLMFPDEIGKLESLELLTASRNRLSFLPETIEGLAALKRLDLSMNSLSELPETCFRKLTMLQDLDLSSNQIQKLPDDFGRLKSLRSLDISKNELERLPGTFEELGCLEIVDLSFNCIETLPADWGTHISANLMSLNLSNNQLTKVPQSFAQLTGLLHLDMSSNRISTAIPDEMAELSKLRSLNFGTNLLSSTGITNFSKMKSLVSIDYSDNNIVSLDSSVWSLPLLTSLNMANNRIAELPVPDEGNECPPQACLEQLNFASNKLTEIPLFLFSHAQLHELNMSENSISCIPSEIQLWSNCLRKLSLDRNRLSSLPETLQNMKVLRFISLNQNEFSTRPEILNLVPSLQSWQLNHNPIVYTASTSTRLRDMLNQAGNHIQVEEPEEAIKLYTQVITEIQESYSFDLENTALSFGEEEKTSLKFMEEALQGRGITQLKLELYDEALKDINRAISLSVTPKAILLYHRGYTLLHGFNNVTLALADFDKVLKLLPNYAPAYCERSACLTWLGHYKRALQDAEIALARDLFCIAAHFNRGKALEKMAHFEDALSSYKEVIQLCSLKPQTSSSTISSVPETDASEELSEEISIPKNLPEDEQEEERSESIRKDTKNLTASSPLGIAYYRCGLIFRDLQKDVEAIARFKTAADILYAQCDKAKNGSIQQKKLAEQLYLAIISRSSALQSRGNQKGALIAYEEAESLTDRFDFTDLEKRQLAMSIEKSRRKVIAS